MFKTSRLKVMPVEDREIDEIISLVSHPKVAPLYFTSAVQSSLPSSIAHFVKGINVAERQANIDPWTIQMLDGKIIGTIVLFHQTLSYAIAPIYWSQGYGSEAISLCCAKIAKYRGYNHLNAIAERSNIASNKILETSGFRFIGMSYESHSVAGLTAAMLHYKISFI